MKEFKIVLTGGPCAGKTTAIQDIEREFSEKGYNVIVVPEAATLLINMGIKPFGNNALSLYDFQKFVIRMQLELEQFANDGVIYSTKDTIVVCDRGLLDDKAYVSECEFKDLLAELGIEEKQLMDRYDKVIHLRTAAYGKEEAYTLSNNSARTESIEEARCKDDLTLNSWLGYRNLRIIGNDTSFKEKINKVIDEIYETIGKPYPIQRQSKYLVDSVNFRDINGRDSFIEQYVVSLEDKDLIYRKTTDENGERYNLITKVSTTINSENICTCKKITNKEYENSIPVNEIPIRKKRICFEYNNQYCRLDIFENGEIILEIDKTKNEEIVIPPFINVIKNVTDDIHYKNSFMYKDINKKFVKKLTN